MERYGKSLTRKSRTHQVFTTELPGAFDVVSGSSGETYTVRELSDGRFWCACDWHYWHPAGECSHVIAVRQWLAQAGNRAIHAYSSLEDARQAHRKVEDRNDGLVIASRKVKTAAMAREDAIPAQYTRGRSKLFKS